MTDAQPLIDRLQGMLAAGTDNALLRFSLGQSLLATGEAAAAAEHLAQAVSHDPGYSAAWKLLGKAHDEAGNGDEARAAYQRGIEVANGKGDIQAAKEMTVFLKRLDKRAG